MAAKAKPKIVLMADDMAVMESDDQELWGNVLSHIIASRKIASRKDYTPATSELAGYAPPWQLAVETGNRTSAVASFADKINVKPTELKAACSPSSDPPYMHLDEIYWEAFRKNMPQRGPNAIGPMQLAGTLLALWRRHTKLEQPSPNQVQQVLSTIGIRDKNPTRAIRNCEWLQARSGRIQVNPDKVSRAIDIARSYCRQLPVTHPSSDSDLGAADK